MLAAAEGQARRVDRGRPGRQGLWRDYPLDMRNRSRFGNVESYRILAGPAADRAIQSALSGKGFLRPGRSAQRRVSGVG